MFVRLWVRLTINNSWQIWCHHHLQRQTQSHHNSCHTRESWLFAKLQDSNGPSSPCEPCFRYTMSCPIDNHAKEMWWCIYLCWYADGQQSNQSWMSPTVDDLIHTLNGVTVFSKLDLRAGYYQLTLAPESHSITTIATHKRLHWYARLNFGTNSASSLRSTWP